MSQRFLTLDVQQICAWLGMPSGCWPPDHYTLLGLRPGETDIELIEHQVHERLTRLRCYQLSHPALATEAMTHLAKAFDCLTVPERKAAYDAAHFPQLARAAPRLPSSRVPTTIASDTAETPTLPPPPPSSAPPKELQVRWQSSAEPPPVRSVSDTAEQTVPPFPVPEEPVVAPSPAAASAASGQPRITYLSPTACQCLGTRRDLLDRVLWIRSLLRAWDRAGKYLIKPERRLCKTTEETEYKRLLTAIDDLVDEVAGVIGQPGQPGYRVLALIRLGQPVERFKALDESQRELLANDYNAGRLLLEEYRLLLMQEVKCHRRLPAWQRGCRAVDSVLTAQRVWVILGLAITTILILVAAWFW